MTKHIFFISFLILTVSCSNSKNSGGGIPGAGLPELTDTQKQDAFRLNSSIDDISVITEDPTAPNDTGANGFSTGVKKSSDTLTKAQQELVQKMNEAKQNNFCVVNSSTGFPAFGSIPAQDALFTITGELCPIFLESKTKITSQGDGSTSSEVGSEKFSINPQSTVDLNLDIQSYEINTRNMSSQSVGAGQANILTNSVMNGKAFSKTLGDVSVDIIANVNGAVSFNPQTGEVKSVKMNIALTISETFKDFKVIGYVTGQSTTVMKAGSETATAPFNAKFYINGKSVAVEEFVGVFKGFELEQSWSSAR